MAVVCKEDTPEGEIEIEKKSNVIRGELINCFLGFIYVFNYLTRVVLV
jgi:hypothetical protein